MYKIEALCEMDRIDEAYKTVHKWVKNNMSKTHNIDARDGSSILHLIQTCITATWRKDKASR